MWQNMGKTEAFFFLNRTIRAALCVYLLSDGLFALRTSVEETQWRNWSRSLCCNSQCAPAVWTHPPPTQIREQPVRRPPLTLVSTLLQTLLTFFNCPINPHCSNLAIDPSSLDQANKYCVFPEVCWFQLTLWHLRTDECNAAVETAETRGWTSGWNPSERFFFLLSPLC